jgi:hypothetical protein
MIAALVAFRCQAPAVNYLFLTPTVSVLPHVEAPETNAILTSAAPAFTWPILSSFDLHMLTLPPLPHMKIPLLLDELTTRIARLGQFLSFSSSLYLLQLRILPLASTIPRFSLFSISNSSSSWSWVLSTDNSDAQSCPAQPCPTLLSPVSAQWPFFACAHFNSLFFSIQHQFAHQILFSP